MRLFFFLSLLFSTNAVNKETFRRFFILDVHEYVKYYEGFFSRAQKMKLSFILIHSLDFWRPNFRKTAGLA